MRSHGCRHFRRASPTCDGPRRVVFLQQQHLVPVMNAVFSKSRPGRPATAFLAKQHRMLIDGKRVEARSGKTLLVEDPATAEIIAHVPAGDKEDIDLAVAAARRAIDSSLWARIKPRDRSRLVWRLGDLLEKNADEFAELESIDNGKPGIKAKRDDVGDSIAMFQYMAGCEPRSRAIASVASAIFYNQGQCCISRWLRRA